MQSQVSERLATTIGTGDQIWDGTTPIVPRYTACRPKQSGYFECVPCSRTFSRKSYLIKHCRNSSGHKAEWCDRCEWLFKHSRARADHCRDSQQHWLCQFCSRDEEDEDLLIAHEEDVHKYCNKCEIGYEDRHQHRIEHHHRCRECRQEFDTHNNLIMVRLFNIGHSHLIDRLFFAD